MLYRIFRIAGVIALFTLTMRVSATEPTALLEELFFTECETSAVENVTLAYPGEDNMGFTNNLRRETGSGYVADGQPIYVIGRVLDKNCIPMTGARVELWQHDAKGKLPSSEKKDPHFTGSGTAFTDNLGQYSFLTVMPGKGSSKNLPTLYVRVTHDALDAPQVVQTHVHFVSHRHGSKQHSAERTQSPVPDYEMAYFYDITLNGENKFKRY